MADMNKTFNKGAKKRFIYGYFRYGIGGDAFEIENNDTNKLELKVNSELHTSYKNIFFYISIPKGRTEGYLILQRISRFGLKVNLTEALKRYFVNKGFHESKITLSNRMPLPVFIEMLEAGNLKEIEFTRKYIPKYAVDFFKNNRQAKKAKGKMVQTLRASEGFLSDWTKKAKEWLTENKNTSSYDLIDIPELEDKFDEVSFMVEKDGKQTTYHIANKTKKQPDIDVTNLVEKDKNGEPKLDSLVKQSKKLIKNILELKPKNVKTN